MASDEYDQEYDDEQASGDDPILADLEDEMEDDEINAQEEGFVRGYESDVEDTFEDDEEDEDY